MQKRVKRKNISKSQILILLFTIAYVIGFGIYYLITKNYEFIWYVAILFFLIALVSFIHKKYRLTTGTLLGASIWGLIHMMGGSIYINGTKLYNIIIFRIASAEVAGTEIFRYDQFAHFYCYIFVTLILFYVFRNYVKETTNWFTFSIILILASIGVGAINELAEFIPVLFLHYTGVGDYFNTLWDIVFNTIGALVGIIYLSVKRKIRY